MLAQLISRAGQARRTQQEKQELHERWVASDAQRKVGPYAAALYLLLTIPSMGPSRTPRTLSM